MPRVRALPRSPHQSLPRHPRAAEQGQLPGRDDATLSRREPIRHFMGTSTFAEYTVMPEIALAKDRPGSAAESRVLFACGSRPGLGAAMNTAKVASGSTCVVFGAGMVGLGASRAAGAGRRADRVRRPVGDRLALRARAGRDRRFRRRPDAVQQIVDMTDASAPDYTFEATGHVNVMRQAWSRPAWVGGLATMCGVAGKGETLDVVPAFPDHRRRVAGSSFGGVKGATRFPSSSTCISPGISTWTPSSRTSSRWTRSTAASS